jgi:RNA polymerase sigma-70 factor (ECF subfamily)
VRDLADRAAWAEFVEIYGPLVYRFARRYGLDPEASKDVVQEVMIRVVRSIGRFRYDRARGRFRDWLGTITRREVQRHAKRRDRQRAVDLDARAVAMAAAPHRETAWGEQFKRHIQRVALERIRSEYTAEEWEAFERTWLRNEPAATVAASLDRPVAWVYKVKYLIRKRLRKEVEYLNDDGFIRNCQ